MSHSFIDFKWLCIGEKIRNIEYPEELKKFHLNDEYLSNMTKKSFVAGDLVEKFQKMYSQEVTAFGGTDDAKRRAAFNIRQLFKNAMEDTALTQGQRIQLWNQMANNMSQVNTNISKQESYVALGMQATNGRDALFELAGQMNSGSNPFGY